MWEGVCECLRVFVRFVFVSPLCACLFAKAEISWLGTTEVILSAKLISFCVWYKRLGTCVCACVYMNHMFSHPADVSKKFPSAMGVFIPVRRWTSVWTSVIHFVDKVDSRLSDGGYRQILFQALWMTLDDGEIGFNNSKWSWLWYNSGCDSNRLLWMKLWHDRVSMWFAVKLSTLLHSGTKLSCEVTRGVHSTRIAQRESWGNDSNQVLHLFHDQNIRSISLVGYIGTLGKLFVENNHNLLS